MVEKPSVSAFQNFLRIENPLILRSYGQECVDVFCINSVDKHSIECIRDPCLVWTSVDIYSIGGMVEKPSVSASKTFVD